MESQKQNSVQELRSAFTKSQLLGSLKSSQESLDFQTEQPIKTESSGESSELTERTTEHGRLLTKPTIGPKPSSLNQGPKPGIKNLVAALEGSHGMYTTRSWPKPQGITVKSLRESSKCHKSPEKNDQVSSKLVKKETIVFKDGEQIIKSDSIPQIIKTETVDNESRTKENLDNNGNEILDETNTHSKGKSSAIHPVSTPNCSDKSDELQENEIGKNIIKPERNLLLDKSVEIPDCDTGRSNIDPEKNLSLEKLVYVRRAVPSKEELGPPPPKPPRLEEMRLPLKETSNFSSVVSVSSSSGDSLPPPVPDRNYNFSPRPPDRVPPKPPRALPKAPDPTPPSSVSEVSEWLSEEEEEEEEEEIYNDVIFHSNTSSPTRLCEGGLLSPDDDIYDDHSPAFLPRSLPRHPPPDPPPAQPPGEAGSSAISNDSSENDTDAIYEETPVGPEYANTEAVENQEKKKKKKRSLKTEQKTLEKN